ncbi:MAG: heme-copper oxidase subunit III [Thermonemataceae bacterium]
MLDINKEIDQEIDFYEEPEATFSMHPKKFALWLFILSIVMIFASLTSAYIVKQSEGDWFTFQLPEILTISSFIIVASSVTVQWAFWSAKKNQLLQTKIGLFITTLLGFAFLYTQWLGWGDLVQRGIFMGGVDLSGEAVHPAGSFVYVLMGVHAFHLITGLIFIVLVTFATFRYEVHSKALVRIEMSTIYWHFLGGVWLYLFLFLLLNR